MEIIVRETRPEDAQAVAKLMRDTWLATYVNEDIGMTKSEIETSYEGILSSESIQKQAKKIAESPETELRLVAEVGGVVIGIAKGRRQELHNTLDTIYILPEFQGKGIGTTLWNRLNDFFDANKEIELEVATYNQSAIDFYTHQGFSDSGKRTAYPIYEGGPALPLLVMRKKAKM